MTTLQTIEICETFLSIQGESTYAGLPCFFIRLAGCNLNCDYCDTPQAKAAGKPVAVSELADGFSKSGSMIAEITGGEPLLQPAFPALAEALRDLCGKPVLVETNGSLDISVIPSGVIAIMDIKTPASGMNGKMDMKNIGRLRRQDEVKFVIADRADYKWARGIVEKHDLAAACHAVLFSPVSGKLEPGDLGRWILDDRLPVRLQVQLHKILGVK